MTAYHFYKVYSFSQKYIDKAYLSSKISVMHDCIRLYDDVF